MDRAPARPKPGRPRRSPPSASRSAHASGRKSVDRQIALAGVVVEAEHALAVGRARRASARSRRASRRSEMPTSMPSSRAARRAISLASAGSTWMTPSSSVGVQDLRDEAGADALDRVRAGLRRRRSPATAVGSTANTLSFGQAFFSTSAQPVMWPPVPTPVISTSTAHRGSRARISCAVVRRVDLDVGRVLELLRHPAARRRGDQLLGAGDRALHALLARA